MNAAKKNNKSRNDAFLRSVGELSDEINYREFMYRKQFDHIADIILDADREKLDIKFADEEYKRRKGLVYVFVIEGKIFKIGQTIRTLKDRISSYNSGKAEYREQQGTNSTTNYFVLQSLIKIDKPVKVYGYFAHKEKYELWGETGKDSFPSVKVIEKRVIRDFVKKHHKKPIGNKQG